MTAARFLRRALQESVNATLFSATEPTTSGGNQGVPAVMGLYSQKDDPAFAAVFSVSNTTASASTATATTTSATTYTTSSDTLHSTVFWGVNAFILCLLLGMCTWCICFGGKDNLAVWTSRRAETDETYQARLRRQHEQRMAARRSTPQKRMARLKRSFQRNKVQMIVKEGDIIESDDAQRGGMNQIRNEPIVPAVTQVESASTSTSTTLEEDDQNKEEIHNNDNDSDTASSSGSEDNQNNEHNDNETDVPTEDLQPAVVADDTVNDDNGDAEASIMMEEGVDSVAEHPTGYLVLRPGNAKVAPKDGPMVPNCCAVCLGEYDIGDTVVWSCNPECKHAFHLDCIMEWLLKIENGGTPCPCCRQEFTDWETDRQERKIKWAAGNAFDLSSIAL